MKSKTFTSRIFYCYEHICSDAVNPSQDPQAVLFRGKIIDETDLLQKQNHDTVLGAEEINEEEYPTLICSKENDS